jgi:beta-galactosidase
MYVAVTHVEEDGREVDRYETPFGFRWIKWTAEDGFFLNGEHYYFHGADVHQDHAGWGDGVTNDGIARDVRMVKGAGMDFIRGSHYPHSPVFADECDRQGVLFWSENSFWGTGGEKVEGGWTASGYPPHEADQAPFEASVERSLAEMIRINRNHPSIVAWSMGNEMFFSDTDLLPKIRLLLKKLVDQTHALDPTRPAAIGGVQRGQIDKIGDVAGYNGDGAIEAEFLDPGVANVVTEYGSTMTDRPGKYEPGFGALAGQPQFKWRSGQALWCAFDHGSIFTGMGTMGMIDYFRLPKRMWYWYRNEYLKIPPPVWPVEGKAAALALETDRPGPIRADGTGDVQVIVTVRGEHGRRVSGTPPVKLEIVSGPGEFPTGRTIQFASDSDIAIRDGEAAIEMRSYESGQIVLRATSPGLKPAEFTVKAVGGPDFVAGVTLLASARTYVPPGVAAAAPKALVDLSLNRPTDASSSAASHTSRLANDGDANTFWQAGSDAEAWWQVDLEARCRIDTVKIMFSEDRDYSYRLETSEDGVSWKVIVARGNFGSNFRERIEQLPSGTAARFVRVTLDRMPGGLAEVQVTGSPL